ncbi:hypothetical protein EYF80_063388 [Liparis tanakae]|uniref:Uncharacterized protein n=1 Tax=Liparis tanakae TaxID=230148 RepID=A0A4Z2ECL6_9TELE|nr:hypothetical protein EYF80_063388 [Liparis tanakae]
MKVTRISECSHVVGCACHPRMRAAFHRAAALTRTQRPAEGCWMTRVKRPPYLFGWFRMFTVVEKKDTRVFSRATTMKKGSGG